MAFTRTGCRRSVRILAIETGWVVTERDANLDHLWRDADSRSGNTYSGTGRAVCDLHLGYFFLAIVVVALLRRQFLETGNLMPAQPSGVTHA